jgi:hypothetical protein
LGSHTERVEVRRQCAEQHVGLTLDLADLGLSDTEIGGKLDLRQTCCSAYWGEIDHAQILLWSSTTFK